MMLAKNLYSVIALTLIISVAFFTLRAPKKIAKDNASRRKEEGLFGLAMDMPIASLRGGNTKTSEINLRKLDQMPANTSALDLIEYQSAQKYTISLQVFLPDTSMLMDEESRQAFELAALTFTINRVNQIEIPIKVIGNINVVDQRLTWSRLVDGKSATGVEVYFEVDSTVPEDVKKSECEEALQVLFDLKAKAFQKAFNLALYGERPEELEPQTTTFSLEPVRKPLGLGLTAVGCISFIGIMVLSARHVNKKDQEAKDLSKTSIVDDNDNETRGQLNFPVQQAIGQQNWENSSDESDAVLTFDDNSFNNSLIFCPSVVKEKTDLGTLFEDQSAIANINSLTDSDGDDGVYQYSPIRPGPKKQLTNTDLNDFDVGLRMAEC